MAAKIATLFVVYSFPIRHCFLLYLTLFDLNIKGLLDPEFFIDHFYPLFQCLDIMGVWFLHLTRGPQFIGILKQAVNIVK
jgi:hypothetical protein